MRLLLDTHLLLWAAGQPEKLSLTAAQLINNPDNILMFSTARIWEITIERSLGRVNFKVEPRQLRRGLVENGYQELMISSAHVLAIEQLPPIHKDPFDRLLVAQAQAEGVVLLTADSLLGQFGEMIRLV